MAQSAMRVIGTMRRDRGALLRTTALQATCALVLGIPAAHAQPAPGARPQGGTVVAGAATIGQTAAATTVTQTSQRAAVNWTSFNVGSQHSVDFVQPNATAATLNRVTGPDPSAIAGQIHANGQVILTNPSGVTFYQGAQVNTQSIVVSAPGITNQNFMAGKLVFDQAPRPDARVENRGTITVKQAGIAALVAPSVANSGTITAKLGQVVLAGAAAHTLDLYGDGLLAIDVTGQVRQAPRGPDGKPVTALVTNTGTIRADGGAIQLTASAADGVVQTLVRAGGRIEANSVGARTGRIEIAGTGGSVVVEGRVAADGRAPGTGGGEVVLIADGTVGVAGGAHVSASGRTGGGTVAVGVTPARTAGRAVIATGARIAADATRSGNGGRITVLSTHDTRVGGTATARGGKQGGDGGMVELSGQKGFTLTGTVDVSAPNGRPGTILLDPYNLTIVGPGGTNTVSLVATDPNLPYGAGGGAGTTDTVTSTAIQGLTGNVHLQAVNNLSVQAPLTFSNAAVPSLLLEAGNNLSVAPGATIGGPGQITLKAAASAIPGNNAAGGLTVAGDLSTAAAGTITLAAGTGGVTLSGKLTTVRVDVETTGPLAQTAGGITASALVGTSSAVSLPSRSNAISTLANFQKFNVTGAAGDFLMVDSIALTVGDASSSGGVSVQAGRTISLQTDGLTIAGFRPNSPTLSAPGGTISIAPFTANLPIEITSGAAAAPTTPPTSLSLSLGELALTKAATLQLGQTSGATTAGAITFGRAGDATLDLQANGGYTSLVLQSSNNVTQNAALAVNKVGGQANALTLGNANNFIAELGGFTTATGDVFFHTGTGLLVSAPVTAAGGGGNVILSSAGTIGQDMVLAANLLGRIVSLDSTNGSPSTSGGINQTAGAITADTLLLNGRFATLNQQNQIANLSQVVAPGQPEPNGTATTYNNLSLTDAQALNIAGPVVNTLGTLTLTAPTITQQAAGTITTPTLSGTSANAALTNPLNAVDTVGNFQSPAGRFALTDSSPLTFQTINAPGGQIVLVDDTINRSSGNPSIPGSAGMLNGAFIQFAPLTPTRRTELISAATDPAALALTPFFVGGLTATTLALGNAATTGPIVIGNAGDAISLTGHASALQVQTTGAVTQGAGATLAVTDVVGAAGSLALNGANTISSIGAGNAAPGTTTGFTTTGALALNSTLPLTAANTVAAGTTLSLTGASLITTGALGGPIAINLSATSGAVSETAGSISTAGTLTIAAPGAFTQTGGTLAAGTLAGNSASVSLPTAAAATLGAYDTAGGAFTLNDSQALTIAGPVSAGDTSLTIAGGLAVNGSLTAQALSVKATGDLTEGAAGRVAATQLTGNALSVNLPNLNGVAALGNFSSTNGFVLDTGALAVIGAVTDNTAIALTGFGLTLSGTLAAPSVSLTAAANAGVPATILQTGGAITTAVLSGSSGGTTTLTSTANAVGTLNGFSSAGGFALTDGQSLIVNGPVADATSVALRTTGDLTIPGTLATGTLTTVASGNVAQTGTGVTANTLTGSAQQGNFGSISLGTLSAFDTKNGFSLSDRGPLTVTGPVTDATSNVSLQTSGDLTLAGAISAPLVSLKAAQNAVGVGGAIAQTGGTITALNLTGSSALTTNLPNAGNALGALGAFISTGGFTLVDGATLIVNGPVNDPSAINLNTAGALALSGPLTTKALTLTASGPLTQPAGSISAATLTGSAASVSLAQPTNSIATLNAFSSNTGSFALADAGALTIAQTVTAASGFALAITDDNTRFGPAGSLSAPNGIVTLAGLTPAGLTVGGGNGIGGSPPVIAATLVLGSPGGGPLTINGALNLTSVTVLDLESGGAIAETGAGALAAPTLTLHGASATLNGANQIGTLGSLMTSSSLALNVTGDAVLTGNVVAPAQFTLTASGAVRQPSGAVSTGLLTGSATSFSLVLRNNQVAQLGPYTVNGDFTLYDGTSLAVVGPVDPGNVTLNVMGDLAINSALTGNTVTLIATGAITEGPLGSVTAATLTGGAGSATLNQTNAVAALGAFAGNTGIVLVDATPLSVTGPVTDNNAVSLSSQGAMALSGPVSAPSVSLTATTSRQGGPGNITQSAGAIAASRTLTLDASGTIAQPGGAVTAGTVTGRSGGTTTLTSAGNSVGTLGAFTSTGGLALTDAGALLVAGPVADPAAITLSTGALTLDGALTTGTLTTNAASLTQPGGIVTAATLAGSGGLASFGQTANSIGTLGAFAGTGDFALTDGAPLTIAGTATAGPGRTLSIIDNTPSFGPAGSLAAPGGTVQLAPLPGAPFTVGGNAVFSGAPQVTASTLEIGAPNAGPVTIAGALNLSGVPTLDLESGGNIAEVSAGNIRVGNLTGRGVTVSLGAPNQIGTLGAFTANALNLADTQGLTLTGPVATTTLTVNAPSLTLAGPLNTSTLGATVAGPLAQTAGSVTVGTLTGTAGSVDIGRVATAALSTLGAFDVGAGTLSLTSAAPLTVSGPLRGAQFGITSTGQMALAASTIEIVAQPLAAETGPAPAQAGSFFQVIADAAGRASFAQTGTTTVNGLPGANATIRIGLPSGGGALTLQNLIAPGSDLVLALGTGTASGNLQARNLTVVGAGGSANLFGSVAGQGGFPAAIASRIQPTFDVRYRLNNCPIASITCTVQAVVTPAQPPAVAAPPTLIAPQAFLRPDILTLSVLDLSVTRDRDDPTLLLPNISDRDY